MIHLRPEIFTLAPNFHRGLVIAMKIDCLGENAAGLAREGAELVGSLLEEFCGAKVEHHLLHANEPRLTL